MTTVVLAMGGIAIELLQKKTSRAPGEGADSSFAKLTRDDFEFWMYWNGLGVAALLVFAFRALFEEHPPPVTPGLFLWSFGYGAFAFGFMPNLSRWFDDVKRRNEKKSDKEEAKRVELRSIWALNILGFMILLLGVGLGVSVYA